MSEYNLSIETLKHFNHLEKDILPVGKQTTHAKSTYSIQIILIVFFWYFASSLSNNTNKQILNVFPEPIFLSLVQLGFISFFSYAYLVYKKEFTLIPLKQLVVLMFPLGLLNFLSHFITYTSLRDVPVSFIHTIKATSPIFTVILSYFLIGDRTSITIMVSLIPVIVGVTICTFTENDIQIWGVITAFISTLLFVLQNIYSKKLLRKHKFNPILLAMYSSLCAFVSNLPFWFFWDSFFAPSLLEENEEAKRYYSELLFLFIVNGLSHFVQNILAFVVLSMVTTVTYSVANTLKRVFVIVSSILWFQNQITLPNGIGITLSLTGLYLYSRAKLMEKNNSD